MLCLLCHQYVLNSNPNVRTKSLHHSDPAYNKMGIHYSLLVRDLGLFVLCSFSLSFLQIIKWLYYSHSASCIPFLNHSIKVVPYDCFVKIKPEVLYDPAKAFRAADMNRVAFIGMIFFGYFGFASAERTRLQFYVFYDFVIQIFHLLPSPSLLHN